MAVRGHTLVWHVTLPDWILEGEWSREEAIEILRDHIHTVVGHYRGRVVAWDVVNEALLGDGSYRDSFWFETIGPEYIEMAFHWAHEADPAALLFYNDHSGEGSGRKADAIFDLVAGMKEAGVPIHGVGLEMHLRVDRYPDPLSIAENIQRYAAIGLEVHVTEMDVAIPIPVTPEEFRLQAEVYREIVRVCLEAPNCTALVVWGFSDRQSWVPYFMEKLDEATLFDRAFRPKPAYYAVKEELAGRTGLR
jgi:endo-1,4-beta-xylanase